MRIVDNLNCIAAQDAVSDNGKDLGSTVLMEHAGRLGKLDDGA